MSKKEEILEAAIDLFSQEGYAAVSVRDITRAVGIKESSLYNHFASKQQLLETILELFRREFRSIFPPLEGLKPLLETVEPAQFLRNGYERYKALMNSPGFSRLWRIISIEQYRNPLAREIILREMIGYSLHFLEAVFAHYVTTGQIRPLDPRILAAEYQYPVFAMLTEYSILKVAGEEISGLEQRMEEHLRFFLAAVKA